MLPTTWRTIMTYRVWFGNNQYVDFKFLKDAEFGVYLRKKHWPNVRLEVIEPYPNGKLGGNDWAFG
jgi:hypothetical protein